MNYYVIKCTSCLGNFALERTPKGSLADWSCNQCLDPTAPNVYNKGHDMDEETLLFKMSARAAELANTVELALHMLRTGHVTVAKQILEMAR